MMQCWSPKARKPNKPNLVLIHGLGANATWQWIHFLKPLCSKFNVYVPDLVFFGESYTTRPERTEAFQAQCVMRTLDALAVKKTDIVGLSYGGFVGYSMAAQFPDAIEKVVIAASGVCLEEKDMEQGLFNVKSIEDAVAILLPQRPDKLKELLKFTFYRPPRMLPTCIVNDFIELMCTEYREEREELIRALHKDKKLSDLPKISQPTFIIWGEYDQLFPLELAHRLKRHLGDNAQLVIVKKCGHAIHMEKPKKMYKLMKSFLLEDTLPPKLERNGINHKLD